jgi:autotransporter-associated beta strand protein
VTGTTTIYTPGSVLTIDSGTFVAGLLTGLSGGGSTGVANIRLVSDSIEGNEALILNGATGAATFGGGIAGAGSIRKVGNSTQTLSGLLTYTGITSIAEGTLVVPNGLGIPGAPINLSGNAVLRTAGTVNRAFTGSGGVLHPTGTLIIGDATSTNGVNFFGTIDGTSNTILFLDADRAVLGGNINLSDGGRISSLNGITSTGAVTVASTGSAVIDGNFTNNGAVNGPTAAGKNLTFVDDVDGTGSYSGNVLFSDGFSPGSGTAAASIALQNATFDSTSTLIVKLGGTSAGMQYDQLNATGAASVGGTLDVRLVNGFVPSQGQSFTILNAAGKVSGNFATILGREVNPTTWLATLYSSKSVRLAVALPGDASLDGMVDVTDLGILATDWQTKSNWLGGDFNGDGLVDVTDLGLLATNWQLGVASPGASPSFADALASVGLASAYVPEPANVTIALCLIFQTRRRKSGAN